MQTYALMEVSRNESLAIQGTGDGNQTILEYITSLICPNNCSDNGNCTSGMDKEVYVIVNIKDIKEEF